MAPSRQVRIIIADDDDMTRRALSRMAEAVGLEVIAAVESTSVCVMRAVHERPDVVLLDVNMPQGGGIEAAKRLTLCGVHVVLMSGDTAAEDDAREVACRFLQKPFSTAQLAETVMAAA